ncbi:MAG: hypothetical protein KAS32_09960, partial [Candidatus Peribacteraceae bacterium]|nr:hypothetical protein [Candidatus Peribacteraceae bacterium]
IERQKRHDVEKRLEDYLSSEQNAAPEVAPEEEDIDPIEATQQEVAALRQEMQLDKTATQVQSKYESYVSNFSKDKPDYVDALTHMKERRLAAYSVIGMTKEEAESSINQEYWQTVIGCMNKGLNPAQVLYQLSEVDGYKAAAPASGNMIDEKFNQLREGVASSKSLGSTPGSDVNLSDPSQWIDSDDSDLFNKMFDEMVGKKKKLF